MDESAPASKPPGELYPTDVYVKCHDSIMGRFYVTSPLG